MRTFDFNCINYEGAIVSTKHIDAAVKYVVYTAYLDSQKIDLNAWYTSYCNKDMMQATTEELIRVYGDKWERAEEWINTKKAIMKLEYNRDSFTKLSISTRWRIVLEGHKIYNRVMGTFTELQTKSIFENVCKWYDGDMSDSDMRMAVRAILNNMEKVCEDGGAGVNYFTTMKFKKSDIPTKTVKCFLAQFARRPYINKKGEYNYSLKEGHKSITAILTDLVTVCINTYLDSTANNAYIYCNTRGIDGTIYETKKRQYTANVRGKRIGRSVMATNASAAINSYKQPRNTSRDKRFWDVFNEVFCK